MIFEYGSLAILGLLILWRTERTRVALREQKEGFRQELRGTHRAHDLHVSKLADDVKVVGAFSRVVRSQLDDTLIKLGELEAKADMSHVSVDHTGMRLVDPALGEWISNEVSHRVETLERRVFNEASEAEAMLRDEIGELRDRIKRQTNEIRLLGKVNAAQDGGSLRAFAQLREKLDDVAKRQGVFKNKFRFLEEKLGRLKACCGIAYGTPCSCDEWRGTSD